MAKNYTSFIVRNSIIKATIILLNIFALASFFFIQVGSIFFIIPAAIIDVIFLLNKAQGDVVKIDAAKPAGKIAQLTLFVVIACLVITAAIMVYGVMYSG